MTNLNCVESIPCTTSGDNVKPETAKAILEEMDAVLKELFNELRRIDDAIYSPKYSPENVGENANEPKQECFLGTLDRQRNTVGALLHLAVHIREGLW